jgi:putative spermidine/putrescine transport system substrate-binding protein
MGRKAWWIAVLAVIALALASCGDDDDNGDSGNGGGNSGGGETSATSGLEGEPFVLLASAGSQDLVDGLEASFLKAWEDKTGMDVKPVDTFCCGIDKLKAQVDSDNVQWTVINFATVSDFLLAKDAGLLTPIDTSVVPVDQLREGTYDKYGYNEYRYGAVIGWNTDKYSGSDAPTSLTDLFDTERFPGKRCMYKYHQFGGTLQAALLADGVAKEDLYPLDTERAFAKLDTIKDDIVWWDAGSQAAQYLANGTCDIGAIWNGVAQSAAGRGSPIDVAWSDGVITTSVNAIPKNTPNEKAAQLFMAEQITNREAEAELLKHVAYTVPLKNPVLPAEAKKWAPEGENASVAVEEDDDYYFENSADLTKQFNNWLVTGG